MDKMSDNLIQRLREFLDKLTDEERRDLYIVLCAACEILAGLMEDDDGTAH